ncbi:zinc finger protein 576 [Rhynchocyon petersi]
MEGPRPKEQLTSQERRPRRPESDICEYCRPEDTHTICFPIPPPLFYSLSVCLHPYSAQAQGAGHRGTLQCTRCFITFANSKFYERHMKREHPSEFVAQKLQGSLFVCFTCDRSFLTSKALITHQRSHAGSSAASATAQPPFPCPACGKTFGQATYLRQHLRTHEPQAATLTFACTECGQAFTQEAGLHQHYIRHARGEL